MTSTTCCNRACIYYSNLTFTPCLFHLNVKCLHAIRLSARDVYACKRVKHMSFFTWSGVHALYGARLAHGDLCPNTRFTLR